MGVGKEAADLNNVLKREKGYVGTLDDRNIVFSAGTGKWSPQDVAELTEDVLKSAEQYRTERWAYVADPSQMDPLMSKETSDSFAGLHTSVESAGCKAIAFLDGNTAAMKLQSQKHQNRSDSTGMDVGHFKTLDEALEWINNYGL